jgi:hypothetical protein
MGHESGVTLRKSILEASPKTIRTYQSRLARELEAESPIRRVSTRKMLAESAAALKVQIEIACERQSQGLLTADEGRAVPALSSNLLRTLKELGTTSVDPYDDEDEL